MPASRSSANQLRQRVVAANQQQIGGAADAERSAFGERGAGDALDAEPAASAASSFGIANVA